MKKSLLVGLALFFVCSSMYSIDFSLGLKGGLNVGMYMGSGYETEKDNWENTLFGLSGENFNVETSGQIGFSAGLFFRIGIFEYFAIQPEIYYTLGGGSSSYEESISFVGGNINEVRQFIQIPVLFVLRIPYNEATQFTFFAGPEICVVLGEVKGDWKEDGAPNSTVEYTYTESWTSPVLYNIAAGMTMEFKSSDFLYWIIDIRYSIGLNSVSQVVENWNEHNFQLIFGMGFNL